MRNTQARGVFRGVWYAYAEGDPVLKSTFVRRRLSVARGIVGTIVGLGVMRVRSELDCVLVYGYASNWMLASWVLVNLLDALGFPLVTDLVESPWPMKPRRRLLEHMASPVRPFRGLLAISERLEKWVAECGGSDPERVLRVPALVDCDEFVPDYTRPEQPQVLLAVAPAYHELIEFTLTAMTVVWQTHPSCRLILTGVEPANPGLLRVLAGLPVHSRDRVVVAGYLSRAELLRAYACSTACLAPLGQDEKSRSRFPTKVVEYLAAGRPVVATRVGELARLLTPRCTAVLAEPDDPGSFARCIIDLLDDADLWTTVARGARHMAEERFDYRVHAPAVLDLVRRVATS